MLRELMIVIAVFATWPTYAAGDSCAARQSEDDTQKAAQFGVGDWLLSRRQVLGSYRPTGNDLPNMETPQQLISTGCKAAPNSRIRDIAIAIAFYSPASGECVNPPLVPKSGAAASADPAAIKKSMVGHGGRLDPPVGFCSIAFAIA